MIRIQPDAQEIISRYISQYQPILDNDATWRFLNGRLLSESLVKIKSLPASATISQVAELIPGWDQFLCSECSASRRTGVFIGGQSICDGCIERAAELTRRPTESEIDGDGEGGV